MTTATYCSLCVLPLTTSALVCLSVVSASKRCENVPVLYGCMFCVINISNDTTQLPSSFTLIYSFISAIKTLVKINPTRNFLFIPITLSRTNNPDAWVQSSEHCCHAPGAYTHQLTKKKKPKSVDNRCPLSKGLQKEVWLCDLLFEDITFSHLWQDRPVNT